MKLTGKLLLAASLIIFFKCSLIAQNFEQIKRYKVTFAVAKNPKETLIALRSFSNDGQTYLLLVNPQTLDTRIDLAKNYKTSSLKYANMMAIFKNTVFVKALDAALLKDIPIENAGIDHALPHEKGITLTIDLCPSHKPLDRVVFQSIFDAFKKIALPAPVALSVSGKWMLKHQDDLDWLKTLINNKELNITWINHSFNHEVNHLPLKENFLLAPGTNLNVEVLENEKLMLKNGIVPSVFFRFPGLVSDRAIVQKIINYGLIPIGSDAWLAKGQKPNAGSIVLIHGNGNEEIGVEEFINLLKTKQAEVQRKQWLLFDLREGLEKALQN